MKINKFPDNLKMIRKQSQLSQEELGKKINVSKQTVSKYEKGIVEPNFHTLVEISKVFNCSLDSLVFGNIKLKSKNPALLNLEIEKKMNLFTKEISDTINNYFEYDNNLDSTEEYSEELSQFDIVSSYYCKNKNVNSIDIEFYTNNNIIIFNAPKYKHLTNLSDNKFSDIPILADVSAGYPSFTFDDIDKYFKIPKKYLSLGKDKYFILKVNGDSMNKIYKNGDYILVQKTSHVENCTPSIICIENDYATFKIFSKDENFIYLNPCSSNPKHQKQMYPFNKYKYRIIGKFLGLINEYE